MNQIESPRNPVFITALTVDQVDWSLFNNKILPSKTTINDVERKALTEQDLYNEALDARTQFNPQTKGYFLNYELSSDLKDFLNNNKPPTLFFNPQDVASLVTPNSSITVDHQEEDSKYELWEFTVKPQAHENGHDHFIELSRGDVPRRVETEPYLIINFHARYDGQNVVSIPRLRNIPRIRVALGSLKQAPVLHLHKEIEQEMLNLVGVHEHKVEQQLNFEVKPEWAYPDQPGNPIGVKNWRVYPVEISLK